MPREWLEDLCPTGTPENLTARFPVCKVELFQLDKDRCHVRLGQGEAFLGAREATISSKRGSPRNGSQKGKQFQLTIGDGARRTYDDGQLLAGQIFVASPGSNHRQVLD